MNKLWITLIFSLLERLVDDEMIDKFKHALVDWLREQVKNTENEIDDRVVEIIAKALGVE